MPRILTLRKLIFRFFLALLLVAGVAVVCSLIGPEKISLFKVLQGPADFPESNIDYIIFTRVRLPRVFLAGIIGAALAASGVTLQGILRNPLADPYILGISSGAGLGVIIAVLSGISWQFWAGSPVSVFAFVGALATVWLVWLIGHFAGRSQVISLLLAGVVVNACFSAVIIFLTSIANAGQLRTTLYWLMGNISEKETGVLAAGFGFITAGMVGLFLISHKLNVLTFGDEEARSMGVHTARTRLAAFALAAFVTSVAVSLGGLIGFVGLIVPHGVRLVLGPDHRQLLPISALAAAGFLIVSDTLARTIVAPAQLPVGVITAITGGPIFLVLLAKYTRRVSWLK